jgi:DUF4097 and DUF4098 domain-containing protein YvlB
VRSKEKVMKRAALILITAVVAPSWLAAQTPVDEQRPAEADGVVEIENVAGSVNVIGWNEAAVHVTGTLAAGAELEFESAGKRTAIEVEVDDHNPMEAASDLEIHVPAGSHVEIEGVRLDIEVSGVTGSVEAETVDGGVTQRGAAKEISLASVMGTVEVIGSSGHIQAETVNGSATIRGSSGEVEASTVNGKLVVSDGPFERVALESVAGGVSFEADLTPQARVDIETVSGSVELFVPADIKGEFAVSSFSGEIENGLGVGTVKQESFVPAKELNFSTGSGGARINVETLSGSIHIRTR